MEKIKKYCPDNYTTGNYAVGTKTFSIVDEERQELLGDGKGNRKIAIRMYYPVDKESIENKKQARIFSEKKKAAIMKTFYIKQLPDEMNYAAYYENVPVSEQEKFPLIMFSMGHNSYVESNTYLLCNLASHGYIIASVGHAHESVENDYEDGSFDVYDKSINKKMYTSMFRAIMAQNKLLKANVDAETALANFEIFQKAYTPYIGERVLEWRADIEKALEEVKNRYSDYLDLRKGVGASGHSLGGCLAYSLCRYNDEFSCGINMDGALFGNYPSETMEKPFCQISCQENINIATRPLIGTSADTYQVIFQDAKHMDFTDTKFYISRKMLTGKIDSEELFQHLSYCHINFFDKYLKGKNISFDGMESNKVSYLKIKK